MAICLAAPQSSDYERGVALIEKGASAAAIAPLESATRSTPGDARTWKALGVAYAAGSEYAKAEPAFAQACRIAPQLADACYYHARALYALNRFDTSLAVLVRADQKQWKVMLARAQALEALGRVTEAAPAYRSALAAGRLLDAGPAAGLGLFLIRQGRKDEALPLLQDAVQRFPKSPEAHTLLGRVLLEQGNTKEATPYLESAVALAPASAQAHLLLAKAYTRLDRTAEAQTHFEAAAKAQQ